ncbi:MAG: radical SAM family heme chaperone HemW [Proteobacteria bacterium]|nr:radical SAM family heme chaperone HemW [Pseudomonadota bacterium]
MLELPPLSLYIHIPWCVRKCPYCDFNSHEAPGSIPEAEYIKALGEDFEHEIARCDNREIQSIFIGGGTPSLFSAAAIEQLLNHIQQHSTLSRQVEITLEANPGSADSANFKAYRKAGINRLSLGIQSFDEEHLEKIGRVHDSTQARESIEIARLAGFENFNLDLMHGLEGQSTQQALDDLSTAIEFGPTHISWYQLTIEPNTVFYRRPPELPAETIIDEMQKRGHRLLTESGYGRYEVSAFATPGNQSRHNLNYWQYGDYLGIGAGAHGKITDPLRNTIVRVRKLKQPNHYLRSNLNRDAEINEIAIEDRPLEFLLNALRIKKGFPITAFESRTGVPFSNIEKKVECLVSRELLCWNSDWITTTDKGYQLLNSLLEEFL